MSSSGTKALSPADVALLKRLLSNPLQIPPEFKSWLVQYLGPELTITQSQLLNATTGVNVGSGSPEGVIAAGIGSLFLRLDGSAGTTIYVKESGSGTTGWVGRDVFTNGLTISDGKDVTVSSGTGTKIGQAGSKLGFFGATPVAKQGATADLKDVLVNLGVITDSGATPLNLDGGDLTVDDITADDVNAATFRVSAAALASTHLADSASLIRNTLAYTDYSGSFAWTASGTAPSLGNATVVARYAQIGKFVHAMVSLTFGSTSTYGTGNYAFSLPVTTTGGVSAVGEARLYDSSASAAGLAVCDVASGTTINLSFGATYLGTNTLAGQLAPWTWAQNDSINLNLVYTAA